MASFLRSYFPYLCNRAKDGYFIELKGTREGMRGTFFLKKSGNITIRKDREAKKANMKTRPFGKNAINGI